MPTKKTELGILKPLAEGGFGQVFQVGTNPFPGDTTPLAYKEFTQKADMQRRSARAAVSFRDGLSRADRDDLDGCTVWPRDLVLDEGGQVIGLLMRLIDDDFMCELMLPETGEKGTKVRDLQWLATTQRQRDAAEIDLRELEKLERLILLGKLVYAVGRLHKHGWVFGDLSFRNAAFALNPPRMLLLDCDGAAPLSDTTRKQASTPYWDPPECSLDVPEAGRDRQDDTTDVYKLGLAILRCLTPGKGVMTTRSPDRLDGRLDDEGIALIRRTLGGSSRERPTAKELYAYFYKVTAPAVPRPEVRYARLLTPRCIRGMAARIEWQIKDAESLRVTACGAGLRTVDLSSHPNGFTIEKPESGPVLLEVTNKYGVLPIDLGEITIDDLPEFKPIDFGTLPRPSVPRLEAFTLEHIKPVLNAVPHVTAPRMPAVPSLPTAGLIGNFKDTMMRGSAVPVPLPQFNDAVTAASRLVASAVMDMAKEQAAQRQQYQGDQTQAGSAGS